MDDNKNNQNSSPQTRSNKKKPKKNQFRKKREGEKEFNDVRVLWANNASFNTFPAFRNEFDNGSMSIKSVNISSALYIRLWGVKTVLIVFGNR